MSTNVQIVAHAHSYVNGTISNGGTLSQEMRLQDFLHYGLVASNLNGTMNVGTLNFAVSLWSETDPNYTAEYFTVKDATGSDVALTLTGQQAYKGTDLEFLAPYKYVKVISTASQTNGLNLTFVAKA